jgi:hypothetical protein
MKLAVVGSRTWNDMRSIFRVLDELNPSEIVTGGAEGADRIAEEWSTVFFVPVKVFRPDWKKYGKKAGALRNQQIVDYCDKLVAFWDGESKGTKISIAIAKKAGKLHSVIKNATQESQG